MTPTVNLQRVLTRHWPVLGVLALCLLFALGGDTVRLALRYDRAAILHGEFWRLVTGSFVHLGAGHLAEDMAGLVLLWLLFWEAWPGWRMPMLVLWGSLAVGLGLLLGDTGVGWYVGISGALDCLWAAGALEFIRRRDRFGWLLMALLLIKLAYEQTLGPLPFSVAGTGGAVIVDAHLYGALGGALWAFGCALLERHRIMHVHRGSGDST